MQPSENTDLSEAFDTIDHKPLKQRLVSSGLLAGVTATSHKELNVQADGLISTSLEFTKGVPQGLVLGPLLCIRHTTNATHKLSSENELLCRRYNHVHLCIHIRLGSLSLSGYLLFISYRLMFMI